MWETRDPDGRHVVLTVERWTHIVERHEELAGDLKAILEVVSDPAARLSGPQHDEEWFYGEGFGPSQFVKVVVHFRGDSGAITTAFPRRWFP